MVLLYILLLQYQQHTYFKCTCLVKYVNVKYTWCFIIGWLINSLIPSVIYTVCIYESCTSCYKTYCNLDPKDALYKRVLSTFHTKALVSTSSIVFIDLFPTSEPLKNWPCKIRLIHFFGPETTVGFVKWQSLNENRKLIGQHRSWCHNIFWMSTRLQEGFYFLGKWAPWKKWGGSIFPHCTAVRTPQSLIESKAPQDGAASHLLSDLAVSPQLDFWETLI